MFNLASLKANGGANHLKKCFTAAGAGLL